MQAIEAKQFARAIPMLENVVKREPQERRRLQLARLRYPQEWRCEGGHSHLREGPRHRSQAPRRPRVHREAYLVLDDLAHAKEHLKRLDKLCLFSCEQYRDLKKAVEAYEKSNGKVKPTTASN